MRRLFYTLGFNRALREKLGADLSSLQTELLPHQQRILDRLRDVPGLVVAHGLGSGKTLTSIAAGLDTPGRVDVLVPASLQENYRKELRKHTRGFRPEVRSQQLSVLRGMLPKADLRIIDEAHRARETSSKLYQLLSQDPAAKKLLLTASPVYNRPSDIAPLVNIAASEKVLPEGAAFERRFVQPPSRSLLNAWFGGKTEPALKNVGRLQNVLSKYVDYQPAEGSDFPSVDETRVPVEMTDRQTKLHDAAWDRLSWIDKLRLQSSLPPTKKNLAALNSFQSQARQIAGSEAAFSTEGRDPSQSPKVMKAFSLLQEEAAKNPEHRALVYSNFLNTLGDYGKLLEENAVPYGVFTGKQTPVERKEVVDAYNAGKLKALLVSSAGGEGLDLAGTRQVQVLEPHWNEEKLRQVIGRAVRHGSHAHLPEDQRTVAVQKFEAYPKPGWLRRLGSSIGLADEKPMGVEQVLYDTAARKERLNQSLLELLRQSA